MTTHNPERALKRAARKIQADNPGMSYVEAHRLAKDDAKSKKSDPITIYARPGHGRTAEYVRRQAEGAKEAWANNDTTTMASIAANETIPLLVQNVARIGYVKAIAGAFALPLDSSMTALVADYLADRDWWTVHDNKELRQDALAWAESRNRVIVRHDANRAFVFGKSTEVVTRTAMDQARGLRERRGTDGTTLVITAWPDWWKRNWPDFDGTIIDIVNLASQDVTALATASNWGMVVIDGIGTSYYLEPIAGKAKDSTLIVIADSTLTRHIPDVHFAAAASHQWSLIGTAGPDDTMTILRKAYGEDQYVTMPRPALTTLERFGAHRIVVHSKNRDTATEHTLATVKRLHPGTASADDVLIVTDQPDVWADVPGTLMSAKDMFVRLNCEIPTDKMVVVDIADEIDFKYLDARPRRDMRIVMSAFGDADLTVPICHGFQRGWSIESDGDEVDLLCVLAAGEHVNLADIAALARHRDVRVRTAVASNDHSPWESVAHLALDPEVRDIVAACGRVPLIIRRVARHGMAQGVAPYLGLDPQAEQAEDVARALTHTEWWRIGWSLETERALRERLQIEDRAPGRRKLFDSEIDLDTVMVHNQPLQRSELRVPLPSRDTVI